MVYFAMALPYVIVCRLALCLSSGYPVEDHSSLVLLMVKMIYIIIQYLNFGLVCMFSLQ